MTLLAATLVASAGLAAGAWVFMIGLILGVAALASAALTASAPAPKPRDLDAEGPVDRFIEGGPRV